MKPNHVEAIVAIADAGSIRAAAQLLHKSQPALSNILKIVEDDLGMRVFERDPSGMIPTPAGLEIIARSRTIMNEFRRLEEHVEQLNGKMVGTIRLVVSPLAAVSVVPNAISAFKRRNPNASIHVNSGHSPSAFVTLCRGDADMVIAPVPANKSEENGLSWQTIFEDSLIFITGQSSRYAAAQNIRDLADAQWLMFGPKGREPVIQGYLDGLSIAPKQPITCSDSVLTVMGLLENSDMVCTCPTRLFAHLSKRWNIVQVPVDVSLDPIEIAVVTATSYPPTPLALAFKEAVIREAARAGSSAD